VAVAALALTAACTGGTEDEQSGADMSMWQPTSGTRLKARTLVGEDGSRVFEGWFDQQRGEYCRVARGENGRFYCFPYANPAFFRDARCREPVGLHGSCSFRYTGVTRGDSRCGNDTLALWEEGEPLAPASGYGLTNDSCVGPAPPPGGRTVATTARLAETALVGGLADLPRPDLLLASRVIRFEDGARAPFELVDARWNRRCTRVETTAGTRCMPENAVFVGLSGPYFSESSCAVSVAYSDAPACLAPTVALMADTSSGCARVTGVFSVGGRIDSRTVYTGADCRADQSMPGHFYLLGDAIDLHVFPELTLKERGTGRIRVRTYAASDGVPIPHMGEHLYDSMLGMECRVAPAGDGVLRCLPLAGPSLQDADRDDTPFADADCARPLARYDARASCGGPAPAPPPMVARGSQRQCPAQGAPGRGSLEDLAPGRWDIFQLGQRHEGPVYFKIAGACQAGTAQGGDLYQLDRAVDPKLFVAFRAG
jgi:hypothetical protein